MALWLETDTNTNKDINAAVSVGAYTATGDVFVLPQILADQVAGGGDYVYHVTLQVAGAGSHYVIGPKTTHTAAAGETALGAQGGLIFMRNGDVMTVYIDGIAGDTTTPDVTVRFAAIPLPSAAAGASGGLPVLDANLAASANVTLWKDATAPAMTGDAYAVVTNATYGLDKLARTGADGDTLKTLSDQIDGVGSIAGQDIADALLLAPDGVAAEGSAMAIAAAILEDTGTTLPGLIAAGTGSGAVSFPVTINDEASNPIDGVEVWISTDSAGASVVAGTLSTDALGVVTFMLDAGTYYLWRQKSGYNFTNPVTITVS